MMVSDVEMVSALTAKDLPPYAELEKRVRGLADRVVKMTQAKTAEEYRGPILFENQAAADFFAQSLQQHLGHNSEPLNKKNPFSEMMKNPLENKLGLRVLPTFMSVVDDPLTKSFGNTPIMSAYDVDDEGVRAQKVVLIDKGLLKTFCMSRSPTREIKHSNGHSRGGNGVASNIYIESTQKLTPTQMKAKLIEYGKEDGLPYVLVARRLWNLGAAALEPASLMGSIMAGFASGSEVKLMPPVLLYKVSTADGKEELLRGAQFSNLTMRVLRDIEATGNDTNAYSVISMANIMSTHSTPELSTVVTPSILVREVEVQKPSKQTELPPILKNPYFDKSSLTK
jgi:predicted Zn-dependent protease